MHLDSLLKRYPALIDIRKDIIARYLAIEHCFTNGGKLLVAGNGGSAADAEHIAGELMKRFKKPTISLVNHQALITAYINDVDGEGIFAQQLLEYGRLGDVFLGISTSGNSNNIINAAAVAKALGIKVIGLTGKNGGGLAMISDAAIRVPETETYLIQECHLPIYHCWCLMLEDRFF